MEELSIGDRVKVISQPKSICFQDIIGDIGVVVAIFNGTLGVAVKLDGDNDPGNWHFDESDLKKL